MGIISSVFSIIASIFVPVGTAVWLSLKKKRYLIPILLGALCFGVFQVFTRIPALSYMGQTAWYTIFPLKRPVLHALFLGATAGLFEEGGRWIIMTIFMKNRRRVSDAIAFGIGHGGLEAVYLVGINAAAILIIYGGSPYPGLTFAGGIERISTMILHVGWSVMVLKSVVLKKPLWLLLAFATHTAVDIFAVLNPRMGLTALWFEVILGAFALLLLGYIIIKYKKYKGGDFKCKN